MTNTKLLSEKTVYQSKFFRIVQRDLERDGRKFSKDFFERTPVIFVIPYTDTNEIYLESQYRDAFGKRMLEVVAGHVDENEDPLVGAQRELKEETGLTAKTWKEIATWELSGNMNAKLHVFAASDLAEGSVTLDEDEKIDVIKMPLEQAVQKIESGEIVVSTHIASILLFDKLRKESKL